MGGRDSGFDYDRQKRTDKKEGELIELTEPETRLKIFPQTFFPSIAVSPPNHKITKSSSGQMAKKSYNPPGHH
jgi:hypothetical protein